MTAVLFARLSEGPAPCPCCGVRGILELEPRSAGPAPRDVVVCLNCGALCVITVDHGLREFTADDVDGYTLEELARLRHQAAARRAES